MTDQAPAATATSANWSSRDPWQRNKDGELLVGGRPLALVVESVGSTPCYLYDRGRLSARAQNLRSRLPAEVHLHYAMKANPMPALVCHMASQVDGIDVASRGELLNIESFREVGILADASRQLGQPARVAVRVNLPFELKASGMKMAGGARQFGIDAELVTDMLDEIKRAGLAFEGFQMFAGSQNLRPAAIIDAQQRCYELALEWRDQFPAPLRSLNLGGGFGIAYTVNDVPLDTDPILVNLAELAARARKDLPGAHLVIELGRYLVGEAGLYVCRVIDRKISRGQVFLIVDGGMHQNLAASGNLGQVMRKNYPVEVNRRSTETETASVVGPLCTPLDLLADRVPLDVAEVGDLVVVFQSGAYGRSASPRDFLSHADVIEALI